MFLQRLENRVQDEDKAITPDDEDADARIKDAKTLYQALTELLPHQVQSLSASEALFMHLLALTRMATTLMHTIKVYQLIMGSMLV